MSQLRDKSGMPVVARSTTGAVAVSAPARRSAAAMQSDAQSRRQAWRWRGVDEALSTAGEPDVQRTLREEAHPAK